MAKPKPKPKDAAAPKKDAAAKKAKAVARERSKIIKQLKKKKINAEKLNKSKDKNKDVSLDKKDDRKKTLENKKEKNKTKDTDKNSNKKKETRDKPNIDGNKKSNPSSSDSIGNKKYFDRGLEIFSIAGKHRVNLDRAEGKPEIKKPEESTSKAQDSDDNGTSQTDKNKKLSQDEIKNNRDKSIENQYYKLIPQGDPINPNFEIPTRERGSKVADLSISKLENAIYENRRNLREPLKTPGLG